MTKVFARAPMTLLPAESAMRKPPAVVLYMSFVFSSSRSAQFGANVSRYQLDSISVLHNSESRVATRGLPDAAMNFQSGRRIHCHAIMQTAMHLDFAVPGGTHTIKFCLPSLPSSRA